MNQDINVLALVKGAERYVFLYDDSSRAETLRVLGRYASNPELSFTWYDAAVLEPEDSPGEPQGRSASRRFDMPLPSDTDEAIPSPFQVARAHYALKNFSLRHANRHLLGSCNICGSSATPRN